MIIIVGMLWGTITVQRMYFTTRHHGKTTWAHNSRASLSFEPKLHQFQKQHGIMKAIKEMWHLALTSQFGLSPIDFVEDIDATRLFHRGHAMRDELQQAQLQIDNIQMKLSRLTTPPIWSNETVMREVECENLQEPNTNWRLYEMLDDDDSSEEETQTWM